MKETISRRAFWKNMNSQGKIDAKMRPWIGEIELPCDTCLKICVRGGYDFKGKSGTRVISKTIINNAGGASAVELFRILEAF